ncbi:hypothetical protein PGT21_022735 [Puccinia graminis f. sp. tritici]|uniref:Uncharacterized protein n=1 Tax=Puccinia graminis f. sp. tritici TaxID=56615 RepID=A0A5B0NGA4_PUCGR|nr:hypothetical protein PGT21_022735 [Puccinia graminis f. sp. tritici]
MSQLGTWIRKLAGRSPRTNVEGADLLAKKQIRTRSTGDRSQQITKASQYYVLLLKWSGADCDLAIYEHFVKDGA